MTEIQTAILAQEQAEAKPARDIPLKLYSPKEPFNATVTKIYRLTDADSANDVEHIEISLQGSNYRYVEGQSVGILPPGQDENGKPYKLRLYSIASPAVGDNGKSDSLSICVKRAIFIDADGKAYPGVCSNYLCDIKVGDKVNITGPAGLDILMPEIENPNIIMVATGTGIAPFRAFLHKRYTDRRAETGETWMVFGVQTRHDYLYQEELEYYRQFDNCKLITAFSREEKTPDGRKMYVQERIAEHSHAILDLLLQSNTYFYICGLRGMEIGILDALQTTAAARGIDWDMLFTQLKTDHRWRVEVY